MAFFDLSSYNINVTSETKDTVKLFGRYITRLTTCPKHELCSPVKLQEYDILANIVKIVEMLC